MKFNTYFVFIFVLFNNYHRLYAEDAPSSWFQFDARSYKNKNPKTNRAFAKKIHKTAKTLDQSLNMFQTSYKKKSWQPVAIATSFTLTAKGTFGIMTTGGTATAGLVWLPHTQKTTKKDPIPFIDGIHQHENYSISDRNHLNKELEPAIQTVLQNKNIQMSRDDIHKVLTKVSSKMLDLASHVPQHTRWKPLMIQSSIYFSVGGRWSTVLTASSSLQIDLTWRNGPRPTPFKKPSAFTFLVENLSTQLEKAAIITPFGEHPVAAIFGVGTSASGDIGIGFAQGGLNFSISLSRVAEPQKPHIPSQKIKIFKNKKDIHSQFSNSTSEVTPRKLIKGFKKSMKIGRFFIRRFRSHRGHWQPKALFLGFQISEAGQIVLATAQTDARMTLIYLIPERERP